MTHDFNDQFAKRMAQSMEVSYHKYGPIEQAFPHKINAIKSLEHRLSLYKETGNADYLIDVANYAMIEFTLPAHEEFHDKPTDGGEGRYWHAGGPRNERRNDGERI